MVSKPVQGKEEQLAAVEELLAESGEAYLVGSANWPIPGRRADRDYAIAADPEAVGSTIADRLGGRLVMLDRHRRYARLVLRGCRPIDLAPLPDGGIAADLARRDFTMDAIARQLPALRPQLDPFRGLVDLRYGLLRMVSARAFRDDPLRVLRGVRLVAEHGFHIESETLATMAQAVPRLVLVHGERLRMEIIRALAAPGWLRAANLLLDLRVWPALPCYPLLTPEPSRLQEYVHGIAAASTESSGWALPSAPGLGQAQTRAIAVLAATVLASGVDTFDLGSVCRSLRLSSKEQALLIAIIRAHSDLGRHPTLNAGGVVRLLARYGPAAIWAAALSGDMRMVERLAEARLFPDDLMPAGDELARLAGRPAGQWLGSFIKRLRLRLSLSGAQTREEALHAALALLRESSASESDTPERGNG